MFVKQFLIIVCLLFCVQISNAQQWFGGLSLSRNNEYANIEGEGGLLSIDNSDFSGDSWGALVGYKFNKPLALVLKVGTACRFLAYDDVYFDPDQQSIIDVDLNLRYYFLQRKNLSLYSISGFNMAYLDNGYSTYRKFESNNKVLEFSRNPDDVSKFSYGINIGVGASYLIKDRIGIDLFATYFAGINQYLDHDEVNVYKDGDNYKYKVFSNGSCFNVGVAISYWQKRKDVVPNS